jgi:hypothetical protein
MDCYTLFDLYLLSETHLNGIRTVPLTEAADHRLRLTLRLGAMPAWAERLTPAQVMYHDPNSGLRQSRLDDQRLHFAYADATQFAVDLDQGELWVTWQAPLVLADVLTYLLGPVLGPIQAWRGRVCLHASAVVINGHAALVMGLRGRGKSTTAAAFARLGYPLLTDDIAVLGSPAERYAVAPGYNYVRLWPPSVEALFGHEEALPRLTPTWDKRYLDLGGAGYALSEQGAPLAAIYVLGEWSEAPDAPRLDEIDPHERLMAVITNSYASHRLDKPRRAREFQMLSALALDIPIKRLTPRADRFAVSESCAVIIADVTRQIAARTTPSHV